MRRWQVRPDDNGTRVPSLVILPLVARILFAFALMAPILSWSLSLSLSPCECACDRYVCLACNGLLRSVPRAACLPVVIHPPAQASCRTKRTSEQGIASTQTVFFPCHSLTRASFQNTCPSTRISFLYSLLSVLAAAAVCSLSLGQF